MKVAPGTPKFEKQEVTLDDQFNSGTAIVEKPLALCNPVDKNGEGILNPANHLVCYSLNKGPKLDPKPKVTSVDQFGPLDLTVLKAERLCVPSTKEVSDEGSCCIANGTPGCEDDVCEDLVCALDPFCCGLDAQGQGFWDSFCAGPNTIVLGASALELCGDLCMDECVLEGGPCTDVHFATGPAGSKSVTECCEGLVCDLNGATTGLTPNGNLMGMCQVPQCLDAGSLCTLGVSGMGPAGAVGDSECCEGLVCDLNGATTGPTLNGFAVGTCQVPQCLGAGSLCTLGVDFATGPAGQTDQLECCEGLVCDLNGTTPGLTLNGPAVGTCQGPAPLQCQGQPCSGSAECCAAQPECIDAAGSSCDSLQGLSLAGESSCH